MAAEIFAGSSGVADAELFQSPGRGPGSAAIPGLRKFPAAFRKPHPRTSLVHPAGGLEPRQFQACGNFWRLFGNYTREQALYTRPEFWSRGNPWLAEIPGGFSETTPANKLCTPGRSAVASEIPGSRKFLAAFRKLLPRTCLVGPTGVLEPRQFLACGNSRRLIGNHARGQALYTRPGAWSLVNSKLAEIPGALLETTPANMLRTPDRGSGAAAIPGLRKFPAPYWKPRPRTSFYPPQNDVLPKTNHILPAAKQCLASKFLNVL